MVLKVLNAADSPRKMLVDLVVDERPWRLLNVIDRW
jgi:hypothetical protein